jgi:hypothetical protein
LLTPDIQAQADRKRRSAAKLYIAASVLFFLLAQTDWLVINYTAYGPDNYFIGESSGTAGSRFMPGDGNVLSGTLVFAIFVGFAAWIAYSTFSKSKVSAPPVWAVYVPIGYGAVGIITAFFEVQKTSAEFPNSLASPSITALLACLTLVALLIGGVRYVRAKGTPVSTPSISAPASAESSQAK